MVAFQLGFSYTVSSLSLHEGIKNSGIMAAIIYNNV